MKKLSAIVLLLACVSCAFSETPPDVPRDHWAYEAVRELIDKGYMEGYADGRFLGDRTMTRYELATVIKRIVDNLSSRIAAVEEKVEAKGQPTPPEVKPGQPGVSKEDLAEISKLVEEFKPELVVIGTRLDKVEEELSELKSSFESVNAIVTDPEGAFESMKSDVSHLKKVAIGGWVQLRYNSFAGDLNSATAAKPPSSFSVRRSRFKFAAKPTDNATVVIQYDAGQNYQGTSAPSVSLKDAFVEYDFAGGPNLGPGVLFGQMTWPFGYECVQGDPARESPERSLIVQRLLPGERDRGCYVTWPFQNGKYVWKIGFFDGVQTSQTPPDGASAGVSTLRARFGDLDIGASAWYGKVITNNASPGAAYYANKDPKTRFGVDAEYYLSDITVKAEYITGVGVDGGDSTKPFNPDLLYKHVDGGWAQIAWNFLKRNTVAVKYETMSEDPLYPKFGRRSAWDLGLLRWLDDKNRIKFYYIINQEEKQSFDNNAFIAEWMSVF